MAEPEDVIVRRGVRFRHFRLFHRSHGRQGKASRGDFTASEDDNVLVQGIEKDANSLGYIPYAYYAPHAKQMKALAIDGGKGCVKPSLEAVTDGTYNPLARPSSSMSARSRLPSPRSGSTSNLP